MQTESASTESIVQPVPVQLEKKKSSVGKILVGVLIFLLLIAVGGLGYWGYTLNNELTATKVQLTELQGKYDQLQSNNEKLNTDFNQTKADFEKTKEELATTQADLKKSQDQNTKLQAKIDLAVKKTEVLYAVSTVKTATDFLAVDTLIKATNDKQLLTQWNTFATSPTTDGSVNFLLYLIGSIRDGLK